MGLSVEIIGKDLPVLTEKYVGFSICRGNIVTAVEDLGYPRFDKIENIEVQIKSLHKLIIEIDKYQDGIFDDQYFLEASNHWDNGKEAIEEYSKVLEIPEHRRVNLPDYFHSIERYTAKIWRDRLREQAELFFLYLKSGYTIEFS